MSNLDQRRFERFRIEPMYSSVTLQITEDVLERSVDGHLYEVSEAGARLEVDEPLAPGTPVSLDMRLPGEAASILATGCIVWCADAEDDPGARRMGVSFERFSTPVGRARLCRYLGSGYAHRAA